MISKHRRVRETIIRLKPERQLPLAEEKKAMKEELREEPRPEKKRKNLWRAILFKFGRGRQDQGR